MKHIRFYKFRYWILESMFSSKIIEKDKNTVFIKSFFKNIEINVNESIYKIKILEKKNDFFLGQFVREKIYKKREDTGARIVHVGIKEFPFVFFIAETKTGVQNVYFQTDTKREVYSSINGLIKVLNMLSSSVLPPEYSATFNYTPYTPKFWDTATSFDFIERISFDFLPPNWLGAEDKIDKLLDKAKEKINANEIGVTYANEKAGLNIENKEEELRPQSEYTEKYGGTWKIKGTRNSVKTVKRKEDILESKVFNITDESLENTEQLLEDLRDNLE